MAAAPLTRLECATCICTAMYPPAETPDTVRAALSAAKPGSRSAASAAEQNSAQSGLTSQDFISAIETGGARDAGPGVHSLAAKPQAANRRAVARELGQRPHPKRLIQAEFGMMRLAFGPTLARF